MPTSPEPRPSTAPSQVAAPTPTAGSCAPALVGIVLVALNLRAAATAVPPILHNIDASFPISNTEHSLLGMLPLLCFAAFGLLTPACSRRLGLERSLVLAMLLTALGQVARAYASHSMAAFLAWSVPALAGIGMANVLVQQAVKRYFPASLAMVNALFQTLIVVSASAPSLVAVQVSSALGWQPFVALWGGLGLAAAVPWLLVRPPYAAASIQAPAPAIHLLGEPIAWAVMVVFSGGPIMLYSMIAWLPTMVVELHGASPQMAALMLSTFNAIGLFHSFVVPNVLAKMRRPEWVVVVAVACMVCGPCGLVYAPGSAWPWILVCGLAAMLLNVGLTLVTMRCRTEVTMTALSSFVQSGGYLLAALGPLTLGLLRAYTGSWGAICGAFAGMGIVIMAAGWRATRPGFLDA